MKMIHSHHIKRILCVFAVFAVFAHGDIDGIFNTQTSLSSETNLAKERLEKKSEEVEHDIDEYSKKIKENNKRIKASIKKLEMVIAVKRDSLIALERQLHETKNRKD